MASTFQGISTMSSALRAYQTQLDVTGENISNAETVGYTRRSVTLNQNPSVSVTQGKSFSIGTGVNVSAVSRVRDLFLAGRRTEAESKLGKGNEALAGLSKIQDAMMEPGDEGVSAAYAGFMNSWSALSASPGSASAKADVQAAGQDLASKVSTLGVNLQAQKLDNATSAKEILGKMDAATKKIADLNVQISTAQARGGTPNDLLDARDSVVKELAGYADVSVVRGDNGYSVSLNGFRLVDPSGANPVASKYDAATGTIVDGSSSFAVRGGSLAGLHDTAVALATTSAKLDQFADTVRTSVNGLMATGKLADGSTAPPFFAEPVPPATSVGAIGLRLSDAVAANPKNVPSGTSGLSGDGTLATQLSALRNSKVMGGETMGGFYSSLVSDVGRQVATAQDGVDVQEAVTKQIDTQIEGTSGVSMDDEMANMLRFQRAYQAAAKTLSTFDSVTGTLIDMLQR